VPSEAVIRNGERIVVIVAESEGKFRRMRSSSGSNRRQSEIRKSLSEGDKVVVSGQSSSTRSESEGDRDAHGRHGDVESNGAGNASRRGRDRAPGASELLIKHGRDPERGHGARPCV